MAPTADYDEEADALYVTLVDAEEVDSTLELDDLRMIDLAADGRVIGVEFLSPRAVSVDLSDVPSRESVEAAIGTSGYGFRIVA